jgi:hypothetical protein
VGRSSVFVVKKEQRSGVMSSMHNNSTLSKTVGHVIISFTAIYFSLNLSLYRSIRKKKKKIIIRMIKEEKS